MYVLEPPPVKCSYIFLSWISILYIQSIQNQLLPLQEAYRIALKPSIVVLELCFHQQQISETTRVGSCHHWNIFMANFPCRFFFFLVCFLPPCHFHIHILWCFSSTKHEWPDASSRVKLYQRLSSLAFGTLFILSFSAANFSRLFSISFLWLSSALFYQSLLVTWKENLKIESHWSICWMPPLVKL